MADPEKRAWQRMLSGRILDLLNPTPFDIEIEDIAHGLSFVARWNGQTRGDWAYTVAEHSILVEQIFRDITTDPDPCWQLAALLHDAPEYVIGDMISPVKSSLGPEYQAMDQRIAIAIHQRFGLPAQLPARIKQEIKSADRISAWIEAVQIAGFTRDEADKLFRLPKGNMARGSKTGGIKVGDYAIHLRPPLETRSAFLLRFQRVMGMVDRA